MGGLMQVEIDNIKINVIILRKKIKNIYFRFDEDLNLVISSPLKTSDKKILELIKNNRVSLKKMYERQNKRQTLEDEVWYLGDIYDIEYKDVEEVEFSNDKVIVNDKKINA